MDDTSMTETPALGSLTQLGRNGGQPANPSEAVLERVANPAAGNHFVVRLTCPEFTSVCPLTGQPDFAHIVIDYIPRDWIVESKSFKLLMGSYRNHGAFHEACAMEIAGKLVELLDPVWLRMGAYWYPRGGIPIDVFWQSDAPPAGVWVPAQDVPHYRGRG
jgi:7-cyano-7-deazaguanine reductase